MRTVGFGVVAVIAFIGLGFKLRDLYKDRRNPFLRALCAELFCLLAAFVLGWPPVEGRLEHSTGVIGIWVNGATMIGCATYQVMLLLWTYPPEPAWHKIRRRLPIYGAALLTMVSLAVLGRAYTTDVDIWKYAETPELLWGQVPLVAESAIIYFLMLAYTIIDASRHIARYVRLAERRWLRRGLRLVALGNWLALGYAVCDLLFVAVLRYGVSLPVLQQAAALCSVVALPAATIGVTMPAWGPRIDRFHAYRLLQPLWAALYRAVPGVVLDPPKSLLADRWTLSGLDFRLYRRLIEIQDSRLALRPYLDQQVAAEALRAGRAAGLDCDALAATVEAATLAAAIRAKSQGIPPAAHPPESSAGGDDLVGELAWWTAVAKAFTTSPIVAAIVPATMAATDASAHSAAAVR